MIVTRGKAVWAVIAVVLTAVATASFALPAPDGLPHCLDNALLAFETSSSPAEAQAVWNMLNGKQANLARAQYPDFAFIVAYTFLFLLIGAIGRGRPVKSSRLAGKLVGLTALVTAIADIGENCLVLVNTASLKHGLPEVAQVDLMRHFSLTKWAASGVTLILFWWIFLPSRRGSALYRLLSLGVAVFALTSGTMAVLGLWDLTKIELVFPFLTPALLLQIPLFLRYWDDVQGDHVEIEHQSIETWDVITT